MCRMSEFAFVCGCVYVCKFECVSVCVGFMCVCECVGRVLVFVHPCAWVYVCVCV